MPEQTLIPEKPPAEKPFPWRCPKCRQLTVTRVTMPYSCQRKVDGRGVMVEIPNLAVPRCSNCGELVFDYTADEQIRVAFQSRFDPREMAVETASKGCAEATELWNRIENHLSLGLPQWQQRITALRQVPAVMARRVGQLWSDDEVFKALVLAVLSNNTDWAKIESVIPEITALFQDFGIRTYAASTSKDIDQKVSWFRSRRAGSMTLRQDLTRLISAAQRLLILAQEYGSLEQYFGELMRSFEGDGAAVAIALAEASGPHKLPGLGIPLSAEFLKNIGYDVTKPDRHINRAAGSFGWVQFRNWPDPSGTKAPQATPTEMRSVMRAVANFAGHLGLLVTYVDNAVWLLCAKSGLYLSNKELAALAGSLVQGA